MKILGFNSLCTTTATCDFSFGLVVQSSETVTVVLVNFKQAVNSARGFFGMKVDQETVTCLQVVYKLVIQKELLSLFHQIEENRCLDKKKKKGKKKKRVSCMKLRVETLWFEISWQKDTL